MKLAPTEAVSWVELENVVGSAVPFQRTLDVAVKPDPVTPKVKAGPPAAVDGGVIDVMAS